ncbi:MAG: GNAT family N-acetyltransferase [Anaerolineaceae bacterium]|nr:GNAT family N-acetyltransferase [Anaerolineaceae bacterium]
MIIISHPNAKSYLAVMQEVLEKNESANSLMLGVLLRLQEKGDAIEHPPFLRTTHDLDGLITGAVFTPPNRPALLYNDRTNYHDSIGMIASDLIQNQWQPSGVLAAHDAAEAFANLWSKSSSMKTELAMNERLYECTHVRQKGNANGELRLARAEDLPLLIEWGIAFAKECGLPETQGQAAGRLKDALAAENAFVWEDGGLPVSMVLKTRPTSHTITISGVYTPPSLRSRGFASAAVGALTKQLLESGYDVCVLFTDLSNPTSNAIYQRIGYVPVTEYTFYRFIPNVHGEE